MGDVRDRRLGDRAVGDRAAHDLDARRFRNHPVVAERADADIVPSRIRQDPVDKRAADFPGCSSHQYEHPSLPWLKAGAVAQPYHALSAGKAP